MKNCYRCDLQSLRKKYVKSLVRLKLVEEAECKKKSQVLINEPIILKVQNLYLNIGFT